MTFSDFFQALWSTSEKPRTPFPWQDMLANGPLWPTAIDLPTASGKTACIDAAIYRLATGAPGTDEQPMPRRLWFVVDRRIVVDEAFQRASAIAQKLQSAQTGPLKEIADRLKALSDTDIPLAVAQLRGGTWRDDKDWASDPRQVAIICTTVDQVGSSLLFRAYGHGDLTTSVYAGLAGNDSLIILDEAHCSEPFRQTLAAISRFRQQPWSLDAPPVPFAFTIMSATLPEELQKKAFPAPAQRAQALNHPALQQRINAVKQATLRLVENNTKLVEAARDLAHAAISQNRRRIAIMVNRVVTAQGIFKLLKKDDANHVPVLITGRMRPMDRDKLVANWSPVLASDSTKDPDKPVIVVTTQCLEVGADFSFDALITECASLDALRQRFGRLDRLGNIGQSEASILLRADDAKEPDDKDVDPIYGKAIYYTWTWLNEIGEQVEGRDAITTKKRAKKDAEEVATEPEKQTSCRVDFGIAPLSQALANLAEIDDQAEPEQRRLPKMLAPQADAPILLPGHLDLLCQTGPRAAVEPEVSLYLHGKGRTSAEARVIFRCDCPDDGKPEVLKSYLPSLALLPPTSPEALSVPLHRLRQWLSDQSSADFTGDVEGEADQSQGSNEKQPSRRTCPFIRWRGRNKSRVCERDIDLHNGDTIVLPARRDIFEALGQPPDRPDDTGADRLDLAERATFLAKGQAALRLTPSVWEPWKELQTVKNLMDSASNDEAERDDIKAAIAELLEVETAKRQQATNASQESPNTIQEPILPSWLLVLLRRLRRHPFQVQRSGPSVMLLSCRRFRGEFSIEADPFDEDDTDERSRARSNRDEVTLANHTSQVQRLANAFAAHRWPAISDDINRAAFCHDLGKLDPRFQIVLRGGSYLAFGSESPLAKSATLPTSQHERAEIEAVQRLPSGFRHEMLSAQLASQLHLAHSPLSLHLITSHHGHSRPFPPITVDEVEGQQAAGPLQTEYLGLPEITAEHRCGFEAPHKLSEGHANRFWLLTRRHGWWGLAYAEMLLRLADWKASAKPETKLSPPVPPTALQRGPDHLRTILDLPGIDGSNPLGALAALGVLRSLTHAWPTRDVRLHWRILNGGWKAVVSYDTESGVLNPEAEIVGAIASVLKIGFKAPTKGWEAREQAQHDLEGIKAQIEQIKASIKHRKLKGEERKAAEEAEIEPLRERKAALEKAIIDPTDAAKRAFDSKKKEVKDEVNALKKRKLKGAEQKNARAKLIEPLEVELKQLRKAWLGLLRKGVPFSEMALGDRPDVPCSEFSDFAAQAIASGEWWSAEVFCHLGSDGSTRWDKQRDCLVTVPTPLCFTNGSGNQWFLKTARNLIQCVTHEKLQQTLFQTWVPTDENNSMRWLPSEDRRYALMDRDTQASDNKTLTVWAANLLGYIGLGLLPSAPGKRSLETSGIITQDKEPAFRWPLWQESLSAAATSSLFTQKSGSSPVTTYRQSSRIEVGDGTNKKINFTSSVAV